MLRKTFFGRVLTLDAEFTSAAGIRVSDSTIDGLVEDAGGSDTVYDFGTRTILPGFIDPHVHLEVTARALMTMIDVRVPKCRSVSDVLNVLRESAREWTEAPGVWMRAQANLFFDQKLADRRYPTLEELDDATGEIPLVIHAGGHTSLLNSAAIRLVDLDRFITGQQGAMGGVVVDRDASGKPTGLVGEIDAFLPIVDRSEASLSHTLVEGARQLFTRYGVTVIGDISGTVSGVRETAAAAESGEIPQRVSTFICAPGTVDFEEALRARELFGEGDRFNVQGIKVFSDGGYSSRNAAVEIPYVKEYAIEEGSQGTINIDQDELADMITRATRAGLQMAVHANGERAQQEVARAAMLAETREDLPVRIEHAGNLLMNREGERLWREAGVIPIPQPTFLYNFGDFFPLYLGDAALRGRFHFKHLIESGWHLTASSDVYVGAEEMQSNPLFGVWNCVVRRSFNEEEIEIDQALSLDEALRMYTQHAADAMGIGNQYGSLEAGKQADLIVLDRNPYEISTDELLEVQVDHVVIGGDLVYSREGAPPPEIRDR